MSVKVLLMLPIMVLRLIGVVSVLGLLAIGGLTRCPASPIQAARRQTQNEPGPQPPLPEVELIPDAGHMNTVGALVFSPDGRTLASASADGTAKLWDSKTGVLLRTFTALRAGLGSIAFTAAGNRIV